MDLKEVKKKLQDILGEKWVSDDPIDCIPYSRDLLTESLKAYAERQPDIVVMPGSSLDVQNVINIANQYKMPLHLIGGGITFLGGSIPITGGIMVDLKRMIPRLNATVTAQVPLAAMEIISCSLSIFSWAKSSEIMGATIAFPATKPKSASVAILLATL